MTKDEVLKLALEAMESVTVECNNFHHPKKDQNHHWAKCPPVARWDKAITAIKEALAQPEQEPVAWVCMKGEKHDIDFDQPEIDAIPVGTFLYTTPPQRTWVGLSKEQLATTDWSADFRAGALWAEAKLKERNDHSI